MAIGNQTGKISQNQGSVAIGDQCGNILQGLFSVAIGNISGKDNQGDTSVALGYSAGNKYQGNNAIAIGNAAGQNSQGTNSIAIGYNAGAKLQGTNSIAIGYRAGYEFQHQSTIVINATSMPLNTSTENACYIAPIRNDETQYSTLQYNITTNEITYLSKTFVIDHPTDSSRYLVHACLEGPENGIYYRGVGEITEGNLSTVVHLPNYTSALGTNFTVHLTSIYNGYLNNSYAYDEVKDSKFTVFGTPGKFSWLVNGQRTPIHTEPLKSDVTIHGDGPYKWLQLK